MTRTTKEILFWLIAISAGVDAILGALLALPGDAVSQDLIVGLSVVGAFLGALIATSHKRASG